MTDTHELSRRNFLKLAGGTALAAASLNTGAADGDKEDAKDDNKNTVMTDDGTDLHFISKGTGKVPRAGSRDSAGDRQRC